MPPFSVKLLQPPTEEDADASRHGHDQLLPATYRTEHGDLATAARQVTACIEKELDLERLASIHTWLWLAGLPLPPRPLHHQILLSREIFVTERMDMHLVWTTGRIFLKPIPRFLLEPDFWAEHLCCTPTCRCCYEGNKAVQGANRACERQHFRQIALGFLFSYAALLSHESDFRIAQDRHLLPLGVLWPSWKIFVEQLNLETIYPRINQRFRHGELRLSRLNKIYAVYKTPLRGYMARWDQYGTFFQDYFSLLASVTVYIAIVLTAMQVGLATKPLASNDAFQSASYGFTIFAILAPLIGALLVVFAFCCILTYNWLRASSFSRRRFGAHVGE